MACGCLIPLLRGARVDFPFYAPPWAPAFALGHAHISETPSLCQEAKLVDADFESDGAGRSRGWVSIPAAEARDQPCCPSEAVPRMRVLLPRRPAGVLRVQRIESAEFVGGQGNRSRLAAASVSRLKQLQGDHRSMSGNGDELKQSLGGLDLAVLEAQSLFLEQPKQLFDDPSRPVPVDDLPSGINIGDRMSGEQPPANGLAALGRVGFGQFDQAQCDLRWQLRRAGLARPSDRDDPEPQLQPSLALAPTTTLAPAPPTGAGQRPLAGNPTP